jgi:hypothetical protein
MMDDKSWQPNLYGILESRIRRVVERAGTLTPENQRMLAQRLADAAGTIRSRAALSDWRENEGEVTSSALAEPKAAPVVS